MNTIETPLTPEEKAEQDLLLKQIADEYETSAKPPKNLPSEEEEDFSFDEAEKPLAE